MIWPSRAGEPDHFLFARGLYAPIGRPAAGRHTHNTGLSHDSPVYYLFPVQNLIYNFL